VSAKAVDPPTLELRADQLVDWLELSALFDPFRTARLDSLLSSLKQLSEESEENIAEADRGVEQIIEDIENEVELRQRHLGADTYPFSLGAGAEEMQIVENWDEPRYSLFV
jgi:hypothetical protein